VAESFASAYILRCCETSLSLSVSSQLFLLCLVIISCIEFVSVSWLNVTRDDQAMPYFGHSSLCFLQCFDTVSGMTGTAHGNNMSVLVIRSIVIVNPSHSIDIVCEIK